MVKVVGGFSSVVALLLQVLETRVRFPPLTQLSGQLAMSCNPATGGQE